MHETGEGNSYETQKDRLLKLSEISLWIDNYDDIFSDFDPRPYSDRAVSDDFIQEMRRATRNTPEGGVELKFLIPAQYRNLIHEQLIKRRLKEHFRKHYHELAKEHKSIIRLGVSFTLLGIAMIVVSSYIPTLNIDSFWFNFLHILLEPGGWFVGWTGLDQLFYTLKEHRPSYMFYKKMYECEIHFISY